MKKVGNLASNKTYNPTNKKPPVPIDADEADSAMERFIRAKYQNNPLALTRRHNTGSTESDETPPPLPPKTPSRFGFRSASSIFPLGSKAKRENATRDIPKSPRDPAMHRNKASQVFGASVQYDPSDDTDKSLGKLRDMGFTDSQRNALVLKGVNGNLEKAIEALVRLGEGNGTALTPLTSPRESSTGTTRSLTPAKSSSLGTPRPTSPSTNPFDMLDMPPAQLQSSQSTGTLQNKNPYLSTNPFGMPAQQTAVALDQSFQNMTGATSQPLFPHHTGGAPISQQPNMQQTMYQQSSMPPMPAMPQNYASGMFSSNQFSPQPVQTASYNPFFTSQQIPQQQPLMVNTATLPGSYVNNPFARSPTRIQSPSLTQIPEQSQPNFYDAVYQQPQPQSQPQSQPQPQVYQQPQMQQPLQPQHTNNPFAVKQPAQYPQAAMQPRPDTASIMALYNYPQLAPAQHQNHHQRHHHAAQQAPQPTLSAFDQMFGQTPAPPPVQQQAAPAPTGFSPGSKNPFLGAGSAFGADGQSAGLGEYMSSNKHNVSRDSMMALGMEWSNGRHSPDAFASLSARDMR